MERNSTISSTIPYWTTRGGDGIGDKVLIFSPQHTNMGIRRGKKKTRGRGYTSGS